jgi:class 3 adenylate cyclase/F0F1-type ATP synthase assembly protein I
MFARRSPTVFSEQLLLTFGRNQAIMTSDAPAKESMLPLLPDNQAEEQYQMARLRMPTRSSMQRLYGFTLVAGVFLGFFAGMALDAVTGHAPYYITRQTLMGYLAGLIAPTMTLAVIKAGQVVRRDGARGRLREVWRSVYALAGFLTGIACMAIYSQLPSPPFTVGLSIIVYPIATTLAFPIVASLSDSYETTYRQERRTREIFSRYVSAEIVGRLLAQAEPVTLSGERRLITVLFSDIRGFSKMSQEMAPDDVVRTLNEYFTLMVDIVFRFGGTVDKFMGDGLMVLFGAPLAMNDQAYVAARTAQAMQSAVAEFNLQHTRAGQTSVHIGIGIDSGETVTGNIGSPKRMEYTAIGTPVNNAFFLSKVSGPGETLITPATLPMLGGRIPFEHGPRIALRGSDGETQLYRIPTERHTGQQDPGTDRSPDPERDFPSHQGTKVT